jgi:predicted permease
VERLLKEARWAARQLRATPGFTAAVVLTLALGIGANAAIFSIVYAALLAPLPFPDADRLHVVWEEASHYGFPENTPAAANFFDWRRDSHSFQDMAAASSESYSLTGAGEPEQIEGSAVTGNFFELLRVAPRIGRCFRAGEDDAGAPRVVLLSEPLWLRRFGGDATVVGRTVLLNGVPHTVVGVVPALRLPVPSELWTALAWSAEVRANRDNHYLTVIGRLAPGTDTAKANAELTTIAARLEQAYPQTNARLGAFAVPLRRQLTGDVRPALLALLGAVAVVLLIACANVAHLVMARSAARSQGIAVRLALGAARGDVVRLLLVESLVIAVMSGALGLVVAAWVVQAGGRLLPESIPQLSPAALAVPVAGFTLLVSLAAALAFGAFPALAATRAGLTAGLQQRQRGVAPGRSAFRAALVVGEVGLCLCLLFAAGLMLGSFARLLRVPLGFDGAPVLTLRTSLPEHRYRDQAARQRFYARVLEGVRALPGVQAAGFTSNLPLVFQGDNNSIVVEGQAPPEPGYEHIVSTRVVTPGFFHALGIPLVAGRDFDERDADGSEGVVIVNRAAARRYFPTGEALGRRLHRGTAADERRWLKVVGVLGDVRQWGVDVEPRPEIYLPTMQFPGFYFVPKDLALRAASDPVALAPAVREVIRGVDPEQPIARVATLRQIASATLTPRRLQVALFAGFGILALCLAVVGVYGVLAYGVAQRGRELAVRIALGARPRDVTALVVGEGMRMVGVGLVLGIAAALATARALSSLLFGLSAADPPTLVGAGGLLAAVALAACWLPARRATRVDPAMALRSE